MSLSQVKKILAVAAGKGGVGKSTLAANLALAFKEAGRKVGLIDADVYGPSLLRMLPEGTLPRSIEENPEHFLPSETCGIKMISTAHLTGGRNAAIVRAPIANSIISQFLTQVLWGELDYLIIDFPPGTGDVHLTLLQKARISAAIVITTPQEVALMDVRKAISLFNELAVPIQGIVENMSYFTLPNSGEKFFPFGNKGGETLSEEFDLRFLGHVPLDPNLSFCSDRGMSIFTHYPQSPAALAMHQIASKILEQESAESSLNEFQLSWNEECGSRRKEFHCEAFGSGFYNLRALFLESAKMLVIEWEDGFTSRFELSLLQKMCPCIRCSEMLNLSSNNKVEALRIRNCGRYALKIDFTAGCSQGIYSFSFLRKIRSCV